MIDGFMAVIDAIIAFIKFIIGTLNSLVWLISSIPKFNVILLEVFAFCPTFLLSFLEVALALMVLFAILKLL